MKKIICISILCLICALSFYGCSDKKDEDREGLNINMTIGKIEAIDGNKITLALADTEGMFGGRERPSGDFSNFNGEMPEDFNPEEFEGKTPEGSDGERPSFPEGEMPEGFNPENFDGERPESGEMPEGSAPQIGGGMMNFDASSLTYSGETETYTVPESMKIGDGDYTSLKVNDVVMLMFDQEGGISEIRVMPEQEATEEATA